MRETYLEMKERHQKEINNFPMAFAFDDDQLKEALQKLNATIDECCTYLGIGDVMKKTDIPTFKTILKRHTHELKDAMKDKDFAELAFLYEMDNHEYAINSDGDAEVLSCFGMNEGDLKHMGLLSTYRRAVQRHTNRFEELKLI